MGHSNECPSCIYGENNMRFEKTLYDYCNQLIQQGDNYGQQLIDEFGDGNGIYENEYGIFQDMSDYFSGSHIKVKWTCKKGHTWMSSIKNRTLGRTLCPWCCKYSNKVIQGENDLLSLYPEICQEWDYERNGDNKPENFKSGSSYKAYWKCKRGHTWRTSISHRTYNKSMCPYCISTGTSYPEQFIFWSFKYIFSSTLNRKKLFISKEKPRGYEYDIYIPELQVVIEYSGSNWHEGKEESDAEKRKKACENNLRFIEIVEINGKNATELYSEDYIEVVNGHVDITKLVNYLLNIFNKSIDEIDIKSIDILAREYSKGKISCEKSVESKYPELLDEWDYDKNTLLPSEVSYGSEKKVHWICKQNRNHRWEAQICSRTTLNSGCPICAKNKRRKVITLMDFV